MTLRISFPAALLLAAVPAQGGGPDKSPQPAASAADPFDVKFSLDGAMQGLAGSHAYWGLAQTYAPEAGYDTDHFWMEGYLRPGLKATWTAGERFALYGGLAAIASGTGGTDVFEQGDTGRILMEDAYLGARWKWTGGSADLSAGQQPYVLGHGLLLSVGAGNGFERGATALFPRKSWEMTAIGRLTSDAWSFDAFYLDPDELESSDTGTELAGAKIEWKPDKTTSIGAAWFKVTESTLPYPQAPVNIIEDGRDGLETFDVFWSWKPEEGRFSGFSFTGEAALQRNDRINMEAWGGGMEFAYRWADVKYTPRLSYSPRYFSGDDPSTPDKLERFDSLYYDGGPATWASGSNGSLAFYNSNVISHRLRLELTLTPRDFVNLNYWYNRAAETDSPIQFGQGARIDLAEGTPTLTSGVPTGSLSHDIWLEHTHVINQNWFLTWGVALSIPGDGIKDVTNKPEDWWGGLVNVTFNY